MALPRSWYRRPADELAPALLGCTLRIGSAAVRITETEAYAGEHDLASHASRGRTARTEVMYGPPGHAYVYLIYGMPHMFNVVCGATGDPQAVLVRGAVPVAGVSGRLDGPGRLTRALDIDLRHNRSDLTDGPIVIEHGRPPGQMGVGPRVGVDYAGQWATAPLRFWDADAPGTPKRHSDAAGSPVHGPG